MRRPTATQRERAASRRGAHRETRLQQFLDRHEIPSAWVERILRQRLAGRAPSDKQMTRWRLDRVDIRRKTMVRIRWAVQQIVGREVGIEELFDFDPANPLNWED
jgi:hypothetical protein